ncbi:YARHG domain-containing protein [uncultured Enterovirga sp.]|uniref:YARHG domain-containing protein n=1 Tax=uncultured Enterovirga sp. TaxID=2026352 RepID=UPI0035CBBF04
MLVLTWWAVFGPASAGCYDVFGCSNQSYFRPADLRRGPNCEFLWTMRNEIYKENGYCFRTQRAISAFGNEGCRFSDIGAVPLNRIERANVATIAGVEREKGCPR